MTAARAAVIIPFVTATRYIPDAITLAELAGLISTNTVALRACEAIVPEGVFTDSGHTSTGLSAGFVRIPDIWKHRAEEFWRERVFSFMILGSINKSGWMNVPAHLFE